MLSVIAFGETLDRYGLAHTQLNVPLFGIENIQIEQIFVCRWSSEDYFVSIGFTYPKNALKDEVEREIVEVAKRIEFTIESEDGKIITSGAEVASLERVGPPNFATIGIRLSKSFFSMNWREHYRIKINLPSTVRRISEYKPVFLIGTYSVYYYTL
ncbi:hypothetical protein EHQ27_05920 [Leptospira wolffii]|nr:hypothetical protein [Leptospira wolffii]TGK61516.1 hypothetical protein EHQ32_01245 [Leptospira wolffii]TGK70060.1 hypothetical protein EHQ35_16660 [Leptospira wolffii]TGK74991.1 hypothetical protein EHQ27_05920 [Leptospira wolffii]TGL31165.1 hypothetical protein EHQ57_07150 [Leptospira wolffii]